MPHSLSRTVVLVLVLVLVWCGVQPAGGKDVTEREPAVAQLEHTGNVPPAPGGAVGATAERKKGGITLSQFEAAEGAGSLTFSKRHRDAMGEDYEQWFEPETEPTPFAAACMAVEAATGVPAWKCVLATLATLACVVTARQWVAVKVHIVQSASAATALLTQEERAADAKRSRAEEVKAEQTKAAAAAAAPAADAPMQRVCKFCDIYVPDEFVSSHAAGKKHGKARDAHVKRGADPTDFWIWREIFSKPEPVIKRSKEILMGVSR
jgi:hypothetical protein